MTPEQHRLHIRDLEFDLYKAEHGLAMPIDRDLIAWLKLQLAEARKEVQSWDEDRAMLDDAARYEEREAAIAKETS